MLGRIEITILHYLKLVIIEINGSLRFEWMIDELYVNYLTGWELHCVEEICLEWEISIFTFQENHWNGKT